MAATKAPKSILKKSTYPYPANASSKEERDREVALYHANLIQERKDIELNILLSTETLIDHPVQRSPRYDAANPAVSDAQSFKSHIEFFQPSDYDAMIVERNINESCGYALCPKPRLKDGHGGKYRLIGNTGRAKNFKILEKEELEKWCSEACAKRALYVRVQLSETPAWERSARFNTDIELLDEPKSELDHAAEGLAKMDLSGADTQENRQDAANLALERGDRGFAAKQGLVGVTIQEKTVHRPAEPPSLSENDLNGRLENMHLTLEGHTIRFGSDKSKQSDGDLDMDDHGSDWL
ncbi:RNA polymerase II subunit B1 CTD phosphatase RPAP2 [Phlyctema vagabunda]|uniref:RNA polymerase II subunit B1 CTD phosphatase RPAP2 homolog n=1 Tax=Phlyctema vagabunda TaxID=108571 RepID=A0ABR4P914_9HELO